MEKTSTRWWDPPSAALLFLAVLFSVWRLQSTDWVEGLGIVRNITVIAFLLGLALGQSSFQKRGVTRLIIGYTFVIFTWQLLGGIKFGLDQTYLGDRLVILFGRLFTDLGELFSGRDVKDQFFVMALLCIPYWFASLYSAYQLTRHANYLASVLPNGILMFIVHIDHYSTKDYTWMFGPYLFFALMVLSRQKYMTDRKKWTKERVQVSSESSLDITNTTFIVAAALVFLAWTVPYTLPSASKTKELWQNFYNEWLNSDRFDKMFASVNKEKQPRPRNFQTELALGLQTPQSDQIVFEVFIPTEAKDLPRLYWRGQVFDHYENGQWQITAQTQIRHGPLDGDFDVPDILNRDRYGFNFNVFIDGQTLLYAPSQPVWVNQNLIILNSALPDATEENPLMDIAALRASPVLESGAVYRVSSLIADPTIPELQEASQDYPDWVKEKYLQLPEDFSPRIRALASQITAVFDTPYDKANAVTNYLRQNIRYSSSIAFPEGTADPLEYFLFDSKMGFCNYSASAEVLMLRSLGIPARLAVGYAQGEASLQANMYIVRERDLHAWPEVYFPGYGWIEFEPTGNQDPLNRPEEHKAVVAVPTTPATLRREPLAQEDSQAPNLDPNERDPLTTQKIPAWTLPLFIVLAIVLLAVFLKRKFAPKITVAHMMKRAIERSGWKPPTLLSRWLDYATQPPIERYFQYLNTSLRWMKQPQPVHATAMERAQVLRGVLPKASDSIEVLLHEHQSELFSPRGGDEARARHAAWDILFKTLRERLNFSILGYN